MTKTFEQAIAQAANLSDDDRDDIGRRLISYIEKRRVLREEIDKGLKSLDRGEGRELNIKAFVAQKNRQDGRS